MEATVALATSPSTLHLMGGLKLAGLSLGKALALGTTRLVAPRSRSLSCLSVVRSGPDGLDRRAWRRRPFAFRAISGHVSGFPGFGSLLTAVCTGRIYRRRAGGYRGQKPLWI